MALRGLVYVSEARTEFGRPELLALEEHATRRNRERELTGYLWFDEGQFVQYVEGEAETVEALIRRIEDDPRHDVLHVLRDDELGERRFPDWSMQFLTRRSFHGLETLLADHIVFVESVRPQDVESHQTVWRIVDRVRDQQRRLAAQAG